MRVNSTRRIILLTSFFLANCSLIPRPDSCDKQCGCKLSVSKVNTGVAVPLGRINSEKKLTICACIPENRTGVWVKAGDKYAIDVGEITNWIDGEVISHPESGWKGWAENFIGYLPIPYLLKRSYSANWYALVGSVKNSENSYTFKALDVADDQQNQKYKTITIKQDGELYFYANDAHYRYFNNSGKLELNLRLISRTKFNG